MTILAPTDAAIATASAYLRSGDLVAFPTETVYGLGADAQNSEAIQRVFTVKGRPASHPLIVHLADISQLADYAAEIPSCALKLAEHFWPGPLTLILYKQTNVLESVTGGQNTVALRVPDHPIAQRLLRNFGSGIVAPSANRFSSLSPTTAQHVLNSLGTAVPWIIDGGACPIGIESTIVDCTVQPVRILRLGAISSKQLSEVLGYTVETSVQTAQVPRVSGSHYFHYAPQTLLRVLPYWRLCGVMVVKLLKGKKIAVLSSRALPFKCSHLSKINMPVTAENYAQCFYAKLHEVDTAQLDAILIEQVPNTIEWLTIRDRLSKAAAKFAT